MAPQTPYNPFFGINNPYLNATGIDDTYPTYSLAQNQNPALMPQSPMGVQGSPQFAGGSGQQGGGVPMQQGQPLTDMSQLVYPHPLTRFPGRYGTELHPGGFKGALTNMLFALGNYNQGSGSIADQIAGAARATVGGQLEQRQIAMSAEEHQRNQMLQYLQLRNATFKDQAEMEMYRAHSNYFNQLAVNPKMNPQMLFENMKAQKNAERQAQGLPVMSQQEEMDMWGEFNQNRATRSPVPQKYSLNQLAAKTIMDEQQRRQDAGEPPMSMPEMDALVHKATVALTKPKVGGGTSAFDKQMAAYTKGLDSFVLNSKNRQDAEMDLRMKNPDHEPTDDEISAHLKATHDVVHPPPQQTSTNRKEGSDTQTTSDAVGGFIKDFAKRHEQAVVKGNILGNAKKNLLPEQTPSVSLKDRFAHLKQQSPHRAAGFANVLADVKQQIAMRNLSPQDGLARLDQVLSSYEKDFQDEQHSLAVSGQEQEMVQRRQFQQKQSDTQALQQINQF